ncbi:Transcriptional regulator, contains HTH domain [Halanaeroarchaeum sp. HSR-CO]|uniref:helix-turn-helix domain-containing protein n=1 Tax=Halanaeroarchaeum sp. HSR-CO TaxID=2866382 RepID=UPI00217EBBED|nr:helix-turn-helix domain-containing protein [Halanaeroarchaeum sp. HSR-CO]UWG47331.1 Transcriptional regulator, contains HTH domain [Halanaeroarchaeum sp. HSR-CO]
MAQQILEKPKNGHLSEREVQVVFEITPKAACFMDDLEGEISNVELYFPEGECHSDVTVCRDEGEKRSVEVFNHKGDVCDNCPGTVFNEFDLVPRFQDRSRKGFIVQVHLPSNDQLSELVADLREVSEFVRILRIVDVRQSQLDDVIGEVDFTQLTDKQRDALKGAVDAGYYGLSHDASLENLAEEFGISTSALSQRLARAEQNVMAQLFRDDE